MLHLWLEQDSKPRLQCEIDEDSRASFLKGTTNVFGVFLSCLHKFHMKLLILAFRCAWQFYTPHLPETSHKHFIWFFPLVPIAKNKEIKEPAFFRM